MAKLAIKYELVAELITIEDLIRNHLIMKEGVDSFHDSSNSIQESIELLSKIERAKSRHYKITAPALFRSSDSGNADTESLTKGLLMLQQSKADFESTGSARIGFSYHLTALNSHSYLKQFDAAFEHGLQLLELVESNPVVKSK
jgi:hypothetical protein